MRHMHASDDKNYRNRSIWYHDHAASFILDEEGNTIHDHKTDEATYIEIAPRFLLPADSGGAD